MAEIEVNTHVLARDNFGRFIAHVEEGITRSVEEAITAGAAAARGAATEKTGAMKGSIHPVMLSSQMGAVSVGTDHWKYQERGTRPHAITGNVTFWWEKEGRLWEPGTNEIRHPGNRAVHFMIRGYRVAAETLKAALPRNV